MSENSQAMETIKRITANKNEDLYVAIADLSPIQIDLIQMRFWEYLTIDQIAMVLGITWDEANDRINETLSELRCKLENILNQTPMPQAA